jgi:voltage-gated potassium channel
MEEAVIGENSALAGKTLLENNMRRDYGVIIVAIKRATSEMIFNPVPTDKLEAGDVIVVIGKDEELERLSKVLQ